MSDTVPPGTPLDPATLGFPVPPAAPPAPAAPVPSGTPLDPASLGFGTPPAEPAPPPAPAVQEPRALALMHQGVQDIQGLPAAVGQTITTSGEALMRGASEAGADTLATATGHAFDEAPPGTPLDPATLGFDTGNPVDHALHQGTFSREGFLPSIAYSLGKASPGLAGGIAGGIAGSRVGPLGALAGTGIGAFLGAATPAVAEAYRAARSNGLEPDAAAQQALEVAGVRGLVGGLANMVGGAGNLFEGAFMRGADGAITLTAPKLASSTASRALVQSVPGQALITQPAIAMAGQRAEGVITGHEPSASDLAETYVQSVVPGAVLAGVHGAPGRAARSARGRPGEEPGATAEPSGPEPSPSLPPGTPLDPQSLGLLPAPARDTVMGGPAREANPPADTSVAPANTGEQATPRIGTTTPTETTTHETVSTSVALPGSDTGSGNVTADSGRSGEPGTDGAVAPGPLGDAVRSDGAAVVGGPAPNADAVSPTTPAAGQDGTLADAAQSSTEPHYTNRPSYHVADVFRTIGVPDPEASVSRPAAAQTAELQRAMTSRYGLSGVHIAPGADPRRTVDQLADAHHGLQFMAHILQVPPEAMGLKGRLSLHVGPQGLRDTGSAMGAYRPSDRSISMPDRSNSFAHEWTHALDHALTDSMSAQHKPLLSRSPDAWRNATPGTTQEAFAGVMHSIYGSDASGALDLMQAESRAARAPTPANQRALQLARANFRPAQGSQFFARAAAVGGPFGRYLTQPYELLARSHEAYIAHRLAMAGDRGHTPFISKPERDYLTEADQHMLQAYPKGAERMQIFQAWDRLHQQLREDAFYQNGQPAVRPQDSLGGLSPERWGMWADPAHNGALLAQRRAHERQIRTARRQGYTMARALADVGINRREGSDPGYLTRWERTKEGALSYVYSPRAQLNLIHDRLSAHHPAAAAPIRELIDHLTPAPGSGRTVRRTFEEQVSQESNRDNNAYANVARANQMPARLTPAESDQMHALMTQADWARGLTPAQRRAVENFTLHQLPAASQSQVRAAIMLRAPANMPAEHKRFAADLRFMLDRKHYEARQAGVQINYEDGYFPRVFDDRRIYAEPDAFEADARRELALRSERETELDAELFRDRFRSVRDNLPPADAREIQRRIELERNRRRNAGLPPATTAREVLPGNLAQRFHDMIHQEYAREQARLWRQRILEGDPTSYETRGPSADHTHARVMTKEADDIMRRWLVTDPHAAIPDYMHKLNRRIAFTQRFGENGRGIDNYVSRAVEAGMRAEDARSVRDLVNVITGQPIGTSHWLPKSGVRIAEWAHAIGTIALMPRAVWSAITEPMVTGLRTMPADARAGLNATLRGWGEMLHEITDRGQAARMNEIAQYVGAVVGSHYDSINAGRYGASYTDSHSAEALMQSFFKATMLTQLTNAQRRAAIVSAAHWMQSLAQTVSRTAQPGSFAEARRLDTAHFELRELGIDDADQEHFARWLLGLGQTVPDIHQLEGDPMGELWRNAAARFADQVNQAPKKSEKARLSNDPFGRLIFGLQSFNYSFQNNILDPTISRLEHQTEFAGDWARANGRNRRAYQASVLGNFAMRAAAAVAQFYAAQLLVTAMRQFVLDNTGFNEHKDKDLLAWLSGLAISRMGLNGSLDPIIQAIESLKYNSSMTSLFVGAQLNWALGNMQKVITAFNRGSPHTNTSTYNGLVGAYNLTLVPLAAASLTALAAAPFPGANVASAALMQTLTSKGAADKFATALAGPKGTGDETTKPDPYAPDPPEREAKPKPESSGFGNGPMGALDDVAPIVARNFGRIPRAGQIGLGVAAAGALGKVMYDELNRYTGKPPSKPSDQ